MSKSVLLSIKPKYCELIASGKKTIEVRKTKPKLDTPFKCYIYCTQDFANFSTKTKRSEMWLGEPLNSVSKGRYLGNGMVIGEFVCDKVDEIRVVDTELMRYVTVNDKADMFISEETCLSVDELYEYLWTKKGYGFHISDLVIYDNPKELSEFEKPHEYIYQSYRKQNSFFKGITRPPQSWCYVEELR